MELFGNFPSNLSNSNERVLATLSKKLSANAEKMNTLLKELGEWSPNPSSISVDRVLIALREYIDHGFQDLSHARLLCAGCFQSLGEGNYRLIEDPKRFIQLLDYVSDFKTQTRSFRGCYRRLFNAYFLYDSRNSIFEHGISNAEKLRLFLEKFQSYINTPDFNPDWITALSEHKNLLSNDPCERYALDALRGDRKSFNDICKRLDIVDTSWLVGRLVLSTCEVATKQDDRIFKEHSTALIRLLEEHPIYLNLGLGLLLDRFSECADKSIDVELREFAVRHWGNPWLSDTKDNWHYCSSKARDMIAGWLKRHLLREFFSILAQDGAANTRRVDFWELYCEDPHGMYFALGPAAYSDRSGRFKKFMDDAHGLCRALRGGSKELHACIMQFQEHDVIEFSLHGNSTYFYDRKYGKPPYNLNLETIDVGSPSKGGIGLRAGGDNAPFSVRRTHSNSGKRKWEQEFAEVMKASSSSINEFCRKYKCEYVPSSRLGSNEWIMQTKSTYWDEHQFAVLFGWGFQWSDNKKGWYRASD